ncbi:uncharacterized protein ACR2FA_003293 [Aphomia sociella]
MISMNKNLRLDEVDDDDDDTPDDETPIQWSDIIFLPFHPVFKLMVLFIVILKTFLMELTVIDRRCVKRIIGLRVLRNWMFYVDIVSLMVPLLTSVTDNWGYQLARLLRLHLLFQFNKHFCNWLPELAHQAPMCLREDLLSALYMYHIQTPPLFQLLPHYFTRQLVARVQRIVVFPNKCIIQEGDIFSCIYFIHEREVEKWYTDTIGERKMISLLTSNGYFGFIPGLFPNTPFQFSYYARTVVDLVYLKLSEWQDLLNAFPEVKQKLYAGARQLKKDLVK